MASSGNEALFSWLTANKAKIDKSVDITSKGSSKNSGLRVKEDGRSLLKNTEILVLPESVYLSSTTAKEKMKKEVPRIDELPGASELSPESWLAIQVLHEWGKNSNSQYAPFLKTLPSWTDLNTLPLWSDEELAWLTGSPVLKKAQEVKEGVELEWTQLKDSVLPAIANDNGDMTLERYRWAVAVVDALGVAVGEKILLAPITTECSISMKRNAKLEMVSSGFFSSKKTLKLVLTGDLKPGHEISIDPGTVEVRNSDLLLERGVLVDDVRASNVDMSFTLTTMDPFYEDKMDIIDENFEGERDGNITTFSLPIAGSGGWDAPLGMENYLRMLCLGGTDAFLLEGIFRGDVWRFMELPVSAENEESMCDTIIGACEDALDSYTLSGAENSGECNALRYEMAKKVIDGEKDILNAVLTEYRRRKNSLDALEYYQERRLNELDLLRPVDESEIVDSESGARVGRAFDENY